MQYKPNRVFEHNCESPAIVINARDHVAGKLATFIAKNILEGQQVIVINTEYLVLTGPMERGIGRFKDYLNKRRLTKPEKGQKHHRSPSMFLQRIVRRMVPKRKVKGQRALKLLTVHESCPDEFMNSKWLVCPKAQLKNTSDEIRKSFYIKDMLVKFGWKYSKEAEQQYQHIMAGRTEQLYKKAQDFEKESEIKKNPKFAQRVKELMAQIQ